MLVVDWVQKLGFGVEGEVGPGTRSLVNVNGALDNRRRRAHCEDEEKGALTNATMRRTW